MISLNEGDASTWAEPTQTIEQEDGKLGKVKIRLWRKKHFRLSPHYPMSIILVERLQQDGSPRVKKPMWLGEVFPRLMGTALFNRSSTPHDNQRMKAVPIRRWVVAGHLLVKKCHLYLNCGNSIYVAIAVDHWYRFIKQRLHWTLPKLATPQQSDRWSDLMPLMTWELWQARDIVNCLFAPVAETDDSIYARTGCTSYAWDFGHSFYSIHSAKTTR